MPKKSLTISGVTLIFVSLLYVIWKMLATEQWISVLSWRLNGLPFSEVQERFRRSKLKQETHFERPARQSTARHAMGYSQLLSIKTIRAGPWRAAPCRPLVMGFLLYRTEAPTRTPITGLVNEFQQTWNVWREMFCAVVDVAGNCGDHMTRDRLESRNINTLSQSGTRHPKVQCGKPCALYWRKRPFTSRCWASPNSAFTVHFFSFGFFIQDLNKYLFYDDKFLTVI